MNQKEHFDKIAQVFDTHFNAYLKPAGKLRVERRLALFSEYCNLKPGSKILEIGCGTGQYSKGLLEYDCALFCADISYGMLDRAVKKCLGNEDVHFFVSDTRELPIKKNTFDAVVGNSILHHLVDKEKALNQIFRVLKDEGKFAFSEPNMFNPQVFLQKKIKFFKRISGDSAEEYAFTRGEIKKIFKKAGFRKVKVKPFDFLHPYTPHPLVRMIYQVGLALEKTWLIKEISGSLFITGIK